MSINFTLSTETNSITLILCAWNTTIKCTSCMCTVANVIVAMSTSHSISNELLEVFTIKYYVRESWSIPQSKIQMILFQ